MVAAEGKPATFQGQATKKGKNGQYLPASAEAVRPHIPGCWFCLLRWTQLLVVAKQHFECKVTFSTF